MKNLTIWSSLVTKTKKDNRPKFKKPFIKGVTDVFYTVDRVTFGRSILIEINIVEKNEVSKLPEINGWSSSAVKKTIDGTSKYYLQISERSVDTRKIAEMVIGDLTTNLQSLKRRDQLLNTVIRTMNQWHAFFKRKGIMSKSDEQGLVGELSWMLEMIKQKEDVRKVIEGWYGPQMSRHDFEFNDIHFEVKTTARKNRYITISSEHQLNDKGLKHLYLVVYKYNIVKSNKPTLPELYDKLIEITESEIDLKMKIQKYCAKIGYNDKKRNKHQNKFKLDGTVDVYKVEKGFPKLVLTPEINGIHDITYSLDPSICVDHKQKIVNIFPI